MSSMPRAGLAFAAFALAGGADVPLVAMSHIEPGEWLLRKLGTAAPPRSICLGDTRVLLQLQHGTAACERYVIANQADTAIVHYSCPGGGQGRTQIKVETPRLMQIDSQGISNHAPFDWTIEARRKGECATTAPR